MRPILRLLAMMSLAFLGWVPTASYATYATQCAGCHGALSSLSNNADPSGARAIRAANNPSYLMALISRPPPPMGGLVLANVNASAIASEIASNPNVRAPIITSSPPPAGTRGVAYSHTYAATGTPSLANNPGLSNAFAVTGGALPTGLTLNGTTGVISGTPTVAGSFTGTVTASNFIAPAFVQNFSITIADPAVAPVITSGAPPNGTRGVAYSHTYTATGTPTPTFAVTAGALPTGVTLNANTGAVSGTPTLAGSFTGAVTASNGVNPAFTQAFVINIAPAQAAPTITSVPPPNGTRGVAYSYIYIATGTPAPTFAVTTGALPTGLTLNGTTGAVSGTPSVAGVFSGAVTASNGVNPASTQNFTITITGSSTVVDLNQHGLTGSWYKPATGGQGVEVEIYPDRSPGTGQAFVSWFTYDNVSGGADRQRWYTLTGQVVSGQPNAALTIYQNVGGNFNAPPITMAQPVGMATLSFDTCTSGQLSYTFTDGTGRTGTIALTRLTQNVTCSTTSAHPTNADFALSGNWFNATTSGQGFTVEVNPISGTVFSAWYTSAPNGAGAGAAGQRWYTAQPTSFAPGTRTVPVTLYQTTGGTFDAPTAVATVPVGSGTLAFQSCTAATFSYIFTGGSSSGLSGTIDLSRVGPVPPGCTQ
jgi:hypothetical protein